MSARWLRVPMFGLWLLIWVVGHSGFASAQQTPSADLRTRLAGLDRQSSDVMIQIGALQDLISSTPGKLESLDAASGQLSALRDELAAINQNNLIKLLLVLSYETYSTLDQTTGSCQSAVQSFMNHGISYTLGRVAFESAGDAGRKALGLSETNYLSPRCVSVRRVTEAAVTHLAEVAKVHVALDRSIDYYRALMQVEEGSDPGERGGILRKNLVVREQIGLALAAVSAMRGTAVSAASDAELDLAWLQGELESISGLRTGVAQQLAEAEAAEEEARLEAARLAMQEQLAPVSPPAPFDFSYPPPVPGDENYHHNLNTARYNAGKEAIRAILDPVIPVLTTAVQTFQEGYDEVIVDEADLLIRVKVITQAWESKSQLGSEDLRGLYETYYDIRDVMLLRAELNQKLEVFRSLTTQFAALEPWVVAINDARLATNGCVQIMLASAYTAPEPGPSPRPVLGMYSLDVYLAAFPVAPGVIPAGSTYDSIAQVDPYSAYYEELDELRNWSVRADRALINMAAAETAWGEHRSGLNSAYQALYQKALAAHSSLEEPATRMADTLKGAELLSAGKRYCGISATTFYLGIHEHFFNRHVFSSSLATALAGPDPAAASRAIWNEYLAFMPAYQALDRRYQEAVSDALRAYHRYPISLTGLRADLESGHGAATMTGLTRPAVSMEQITTLLVAYGESVNLLREVRSHAEARVLPEAALLDPMPDGSAVYAKPHVEDPLVVALPVYGLVLIMEQMDARFAVLMDSPVRDEPAMWTLTYTIAAMVNEWKAAHLDVQLAQAYWTTANLIRNDRLYEKRMAWEAAFAPPTFTDVSPAVAIPPGQSGRLSVTVESHKSTTVTWFRRGWFGPDEEVGSGTSLVVVSPEGLERYYARATNEFGSQQSGTIEVYPAAPPRLAFQPQGIVVAPGSAARLEVSYYLTVGSAVVQAGQWYVSTGATPATGYQPVPGSFGTILNLTRVTAPRWYYYVATNPWGSTTSEAVLVNLLGDQSTPMLVPRDPLTVYVGVPFLDQIDAARSGSFEWVPPTDAPWLTFNAAEGVFSGVPAGLAGTHVEVTVRAVRQDGGVTIRSSPVVFRFVIQPADQWPGPRGLRYFTQIELLNPAIGGMAADPDRDGFPNALEYLLGTNPRGPDSRERRPSLAVAAHAVDYSFRRVVARPDLRYRVESSADLNHWSSVPALEGNPIDHGDGTETVTFRISGGTAAVEQQYVRLKVFTP